MQVLAQILQSLEDFILADNDLAGSGYLRFEHEGIQQLGFPYIRSSHDRFARMLVRANEHLTPEKRTPRFLEVGCGIGTKCEIARIQGFETTGIDLDPRYIELAQRLFHHNRFVEANALTFDYSGFELIYYHTPLANDLLMRQLEKQVLSTMSIGSIWCVTRLTSQLEQNLDSTGASAANWTAAIASLNLDEDQRLRCLRKTADIQDLDGLVGSSES